MGEEDIEKLSGPGTSSIPSLLYSRNPEEYYVRQSPMDKRASVKVRVSGR